MATSASSSVTSGTLGNVAPVSFPGIASGIDYNSIIEKYTAETLLQEKPDQAQINNLNSQNTALLKITNLIGAVQDSLTALSNPTLFGAYKATVGNNATGSPVATATQIPGQEPVAGTYIINAQTAATATSVTNNPAANAPINATSQPLDNSGASITATNGTTSNGVITINGIALNYDVTVQTLSSIVSEINTALKTSDGGSATLNANGTVTLTGVTSIGSGGDSGNLEQVLKLDTAQWIGVDPTAALSTDKLAASLDPNALLSADSLPATPTSGNIVVNGVAVAYTTGQSLSTIVANINASGSGATATVVGNQVNFTGVTTLADSGGGNLVEALGLSTPSAGLSNGAILSSPVAPGNIVVNGVSVAYTTAQSLNTIIANINSSGSGATASLVNGRVTITGITGLADGGGGNLVEALGLSAPAAGTSTGTNLTSVTSSSDIAGLNLGEPFSASDQAGFATAVTSGTFTINGTQFTVNSATDNLSDLIQEINSSAAGVTATYNAETSQLTLVSKTAGPQSILLGAGSDTSNFLSAAGLTTGTTVTGTQASLTYTNPQGAQVTAFSATNDFTNAIPGIDLKVTSSSTSGYTVNVASDPSQAETAIGTFIKAYNAAIVELNKDTQAPSVTAGADASNGISQSSSTGGGVLYGNYQVSGLRDTLVNLVSGFIPSGSNAYNSLQSVGILLDTSSQEVGADSADSTDSNDSDSKTSNSANNSFTVTATSGQLQALDTTLFEAAYAADTASVQSLFTAAPKLSGTQPGAQPIPGTTYGFAYLLGSQLANIDGLSTFLTGSVVTPTDLSNILLQNVIDSNNKQIDSIQQQISLINREATQQADNLRQQFTASESQIAELQALQSQIAAIGH